MSKQAKTIRLVMPQWQGGNNPLYQLGAELLAWLAPQTDMPTFNIPVSNPKAPLQNEDGIMGRGQIGQQLDAAYRLLDEQKPDKIVMLGGDCLVDLAPFSYLSTLYGNDFGILWLDAHPDVMTPKEFAHSHAHVLGALMGNGDAALTRDVKHPVPADKIMIAGMHSPTAYEATFLHDHAIKTLSPEALKADMEAVTEWIAQQKIKHLAIHFDLDVLDHQLFRALLMAEPGVDAARYAGIAEGRLTMDDVVSLIKKVDAATDVVGLGITEHLPWDALNLKNMLAQLPLIG
ncbi:arginase family protein [Bartonella sp. LJL80]